MHTCNCSLTTIGNLNIIDRFLPENNNPRQVIIQVEYGGTAEITTADIRDSIYMLVVMDLATLTVAIVCYSSLTLHQVLLQPH